MAERMAPRFRRNRSRSTSTQVGNSMSYRPCRPLHDYHTGIGEGKRGRLRFPSGGPYTRGRPSDEKESGTAKLASPPAPDRDEFAAAAAALLDLVRHLS